MCSKGDSICGRGNENGSDYNNAGNGGNDDVIGCGSNDYIQIQVLVTGSLPTMSKQVGQQAGGSNSYDTYNNYVSNDSNGIVVMLVILDRI